MKVYVVRSTGLARRDHRFFFPRSSSELVTRALCEAEVAELKDGTVEDQGNRRRGWIKHKRCVFVS